MKKLIPYLLIFICFSCDDLFHEEEISIGKIESVAELESAVNGLYGLLAHAIQDNDGLSFRAINLKGDDIILGNADYSNYYYDSEEYYCWTYSGNENYRQDANWSNLYHIITSANNIITQFETRVTLSRQMEELLGEAYFFRAYTYFRLTRTFGQVPLVKDIDIDYSIPLSSFETIYSFIEKDLEKAKQLLPANSSVTRNPFYVPHKGTAKALLAEVYLSWAGYPVKDNLKYARAASEAGETLDSADYFGFGLMPDFIHLWEKEYNGNPETVFAIYYADPVQAIAFNEINMVYWGYYQESRYQGIQTSPNSACFIPGFSPVEVNFFNDFPDSYRKDITFFTTIYVPDEYPYYPQIDTGFVHISTTDICDRIAYRKFYVENTIIRWSDIEEIPFESPLILYMGNSKIYLLRYAHTLLTYAEAMARSGQLDASAYEAVNRIRRRANNMYQHASSIYDLTPGLSAEAFADSVVQERAWELAGEFEGRWFDLVRLEKVEDLPDLRHPDEGGFPEEAVTKENYFFSIPQEEQYLNPNLSE